MALVCSLNPARECDGCMDCMADPDRIHYTDQEDASGPYVCVECGVEIQEDEAYFEIGGKVLCACCNTGHRRVRGVHYD